MKDLHLEQAAGVDERYAVVYVPGRNRKRFSENCVRVVGTAAAAIAEADAEKGFHPAIVIGPSRSSEGFRLFYLKAWLN